MADYGSSATFNRALTLLRRKHPQAQTAIDRLVPALEEMYRLRRGPKPRSPNWFERYNPQAGVPRTSTPAWRRALALAEQIYANVLWLIDQPPIDLDIKPALIELGSIPYDTVLDDDDDSPDDYGVRVPAGELPQLIGTGAYGWSPEETGDLIVDALSSESRGGHLSDDQIKQTIAEKIWSTEGHLELVPIDKIVACDFIATHHSALPTCNPRGMLYAIGARYRGQLVAVATAGTPTGRWGPGADCPVDGILELTRIASIGGLTRTDRRGRTVPLSASSALAARVIDLLPASGRGVLGCRFITYSLTSERATTYLSLISKGLRPVARRAGRPPLRRAELPRRAPRFRQDPLGSRPRRAPPRLDPDPRTTPPRRHPSLRRRP
jgi:hypothetical protein